MSLLRDIVTIEKGKGYDLLDEFQEGAIRVFQANDFRNEKKPQYTLTKEGLTANEDDILVVWDGSVGQMGFGKNGFVGSTIVRVRVKDKQEFSPFFIYKFLQTKSEFLKRKSTGATIKHINRKSLESLIIPPIPIAKQLQIANVLGKTESLVEQRKQSITLLDDLLRSSFLEMFYTNPEIEKWKEVRFAELAEKKRGSMRSGPFGSSLLHGEFTETGDVKVLGIDNVVTNKFQWKRNRCITLEKFQQLKRYQVFPNDVLISIMATLGRTAVVPDNIPICINSKHLAAITLDKKIANPHFVSFAFHSHPIILRQMSSKVKGAIMDGLNLTIIQKLLFKLPPIELQNKFAELLNKVELIKEQNRNSLVELETLFGSLSEKAFKGELVSKKSDAKVIALVAETKLVQPELNKQQAFLRKLMLASHIIYELCDEPTFGHTKLMKLLYLSEQAGGMALQTNYKKFAAGPFDGKMLTLLDQEFVKNKWFGIEKKTFTIGGQKREATVYKKTDKSLLYKKHFDNYFESETETINRIIELFRKEKTQTAEIVATLYFAWKELATANTMISKDSLVKGFYRFHKEKKKFTEEQILIGYEYMQKNELYPHS